MSRIVGLTVNTESSLDDSIGCEIEMSKEASLKTLREVFVWSSAVWISQVSRSADLPLEQGLKATFANIP